MKKIRICMLHNMVRNEADIYRYLQLDSKNTEYELIWDDEKPEYLIATELIYTDLVLWNKFVKLYLIAQICIYHSGECIAPDMNIFDYAVVFDKNLKCEDRIIRMSTRKFFSNLIFKTKNELVGKEDSLRDDILNGKKFCNYIYSNGHGHNNRTEIFHVLSKYKKVDSLGKYLNNVGEVLKVDSRLGFVPMIKECIDVKSNYKFSIAFENAIYNGYTSEKIFSSLEAHTVPIYWGNPLIAEEINPKAFVNCHNYNSLEEVLEEVKRIDNDDELWIKMVCSPWKTEIQEKEEQKEIQEYYTFFKNIFMQSIDRAKRRGEGFHPNRYRQWFFQTQSDNNKFQSYHEIEIKWIEKLRRGISLNKYFIDNNYKTIVIYGLSQIGLELFYELEKSEGVSVIYGIDMGNPVVPLRLKYYKLNELMDKDVPDVIVVMIPHLFVKIEKDLKEIYNCPIVSISEVLEI